MLEISIPPTAEELEKLLKTFSTDFKHPHKDNEQCLDCQFVSTVLNNKEIAHLYITALSDWLRENKIDTMAKTFVITFILGQMWQQHISDIATQAENILKAPATASTFSAFDEIKWLEDLLKKDSEKE